MSIVSHLAPYFDHYITLERVHLTHTYDYIADSRRFFGLAVIESVRHMAKCKRGESWLYVAVPASADLTSLSQREKLYVGSQTVDRMFRGDGMAGKNFHHAQMRKGNGEDNLENFLRSGEKVHIYRISVVSIEKAVKQEKYLSCFEPLLNHKHVGYWFEQLILYSEGKEWRWNIAGVDGKASSVLQAAGHGLFENKKVTNV